MRLISASSLWWLLLGAPIILLYLLKLKRTRHVVSSILLWRRAIQDMEANVPFRRLRRNLLLILQLTALVLIVLGLSRPAVNTHRLSRGSTVIVVDDTASMGARDEDGGRASRLERAKQIVRQMLDGVGGATSAALIESSARTRLVCPLTSDRSRLVAALDEIRPTDESGDLREAVLLAAELAKAQQGSEVVALSDGGGPATAIDPQGARIRYIRVGQHANNVGIVAMNTRTLAGGRQELFASVANFSDTEKSLQAELRVNGALVDVRGITLGAAAAATPAEAATKTITTTAGLTKPDSATPPDGARPSNPRALIFDSLPSDGGLAELKLDIDDDLSCDNVAYAMVKSARRPSVGVAASNRFLWQAFASDPDIETHRLDADAEYDWAQYDVIVAEGGKVSRPLKSDRALLAVNPPDLPGFCVAEPGKSAPSTAGDLTADPSHPVNLYLSYAGVNFDQRNVLKPAGWLKPIVSDSAGGLIWAGENNGRRTVLLGFDLARTDLPVRMEFPILMANCIAWLSQTSSESLYSTKGGAIRTGLPFRLQSGASQISIQRPDGTAMAYKVQDGVVTVDDTSRVGLYTAKEPGVQIAASLLSSLESDTRPRDSLTTTAGEIQTSAETFKSEAEVWSWLLCAAVAVLALEWAVYLRRQTG